LVFFDDLTSLTIEDGVDTTDGSFRALNFDKVDGFHEAWLSSELSTIEDTASSGDELTTTTMDGISMENDIKKIETNTAQVFFTENTFLGDPLETSDNGVLDFIQVLDSLGDINDEVGSSAFGTETPDLTGISDIHVEVISEVTTTSLGVITSTNLSGIDFLRLSGKGSARQ